jgi:hypothetical protein
MADPLATLATYWSLEDCAVQRSALDAASIRNFADDFFLVNIDWFYANMAHGIKLRVAREDLQNAAEILEGASEVGEPEAFEEPIERCPECESTNIERTRKWLVFAGLAPVSLGAAIALDVLEPAVFIVIAGFLMTLMAPSRRCGECDERW